MAKAPMRLPRVIRDSASAMCRPVRSCRTMTGRMPALAASSITGLRGYAKSVSTPSRRRISAIAADTFIEDAAPACTKHWRSWPRLAEVVLERNRPRPRHPRRPLDRGGRSPVVEDVGVVELVGQVLAFERQLPNLVRRPVSEAGVHQQAVLDV